ncbi:PHD-finger [Seminavis robusta]|uniref:PHD-finger n=1 Tax=Seminavis robusta TaxID=568900 RepID=A0A9N8E1C2_9STRA|nr:PHD-finger [Seminavis robusta]|eukprot:Sro448_g145220.1 PHD-finger (1180) ;mRNA; r:51689-55316
MTKTSRGSGKAKEATKVSKKSKHVKEDKVKGNKKKDKEAEDETQPEAEKRTTSTTKSTKDTPARVSLGRNKKSPKLSQDDSLDFVEEEEPGKDSAIKTKAAARKKADNPNDKQAAKSNGKEMSSDEEEASKTDETSEKSREDDDVAACCMCHCALDYSDRAAFFEADRLKEVEEHENNNASDESNKPLYFQPTDPYVPKSLFDPANALVYCEGGCNRLFHQKCHFVPVMVLPRGKWICLVCSTTSKLIKNRNKKKKEKANTAPFTKRQLRRMFQTPFPPAKLQLIMSTDEKVFHTKAEKQWEIATGHEKALLWNRTLTQIIPNWIQSQMSNFSQAQTALETLTRTKQNRQHFLENKASKRGSQELAQTLVKLAGAKWKMRQMMMNLKEIQVNPERHIQLMHQWCQPPISPMNGNNNNGTTTNIIVKSDGNALPTATTETEGTASTTATTTATDAVAATDAKPQATEVKPEGAEAEAAAKDEVKPEAATEAEAQELEAKPEATEVAAGTEPKPEATNKDTSGAAKSSCEIPNTITAPNSSTAEATIARPPPKSFVDRVLFPFGMHTPRSIPRTPEMLETNDGEASSDKAASDGGGIPSEIKVTSLSSDDKECNDGAKRTNGKSGSAKKKQAATTKTAKAKADDESDSSGVSLDDLKCCICLIGDASDENDLLMCDMQGCFRAFHMGCLEPRVTLDEVESKKDEDWFCPLCSNIANCMHKMQSYYMGEEWEQRRRERACAEAKKAKAKNKASPKGKKKDDNPENLVKPADNEDSSDEDSLKSWDQPDDVFPESKWDYETALQLKAGERNDDTDALLQQVLGTGGGHEEGGETKLIDYMSDGTDDVELDAHFDLEAFHEERQKEYEEMEEEEEDSDDDSSHSSKATLVDMSSVELKIGKDELNALDGSDSSESEEDSEKGDDDDDEASGGRRRRSRRLRSRKTPEDVPKNVGVEFDMGNIVQGKRRRKPVDYRKLNDTLFGDLNEKEIANIDDKEDFQVPMKKVTPSSSSGDDDSDSDNDSDGEDDANDSNGENQESDEEQQDDKSSEKKSNDQNARKKRKRAALKEDSDVDSGNEAENDDSSTDSKTGKKKRTAKKAKKSTKKKRKSPPATSTKANGSKSPNGRTGKTVKAKTTTKTKRSTKANIAKEAVEGKATKKGAKKAAKVPQKKKGGKGSKKTKNE